MDDVHLAPDDLFRKERVLHACRTYIHRVKTWTHILTDGKGGYSGVEYLVERALGVGEGSITMDLPAVHTYAVELSSRTHLPDHVLRLAPAMVEEKAYDLIVATGVFYKHYDWPMLHELVSRAARGIVVTSHLDEDEMPLGGRVIHEEFLAHGGRVEHLCVYDYSPRS